MIGTNHLDNIPDNLFVFMNSNVSKSYSTSKVSCQLGRDDFFCLKFHKYFSHRFGRLNSE